MAGSPVTRNGAAQPGGQGVTRVRWPDYLRLTVVLRLVSGSRRQDEYSSVAYTSSPEWLGNPVRGTNPDVVR